MHNLEEYEKMFVFQVPPLERGVPEELFLSAPSRPPIPFTHIKAVTGFYFGYKLVPGFHGSVDLQQELLQVTESMLSEPCVPLLCLVKIYLIEGGMVPIQSDREQDKGITGIYLQIAKYLALKKDNKIKILRED